MGSAEGACRDVAGPLLHSGKLEPAAVALDHVADGERFYGTRTVTTSGSVLKPIARRALQAVGIVVALLGAGFVIRALVRDWPQVSALVADASLGWLLAALGLGIFAMTGIALVWTHELRRRTASVTATDGVSWYFIGELAKYVPGGIWSVIGRGELAVRGGVGRVDAYTSTFLSLGATFGAALVVALVSVPVHDGVVPLGLGRAGQAAITFAILLVGTVGLLLASRLLPNAPAVPGSQAGRERPIGLGALQLRSVPLLLLLSIPVWLVLGISTWMIAAGFGIRIPLSEAVFATSLAWFIGFVIVPVPGGIGVREAVLVWALSSVSPGTAAAIAAVSRAISMASDLMGAGVCAGIASLRERKR